MPSLRDIAANSTIRSTVSSNFAAFGINAFAIAPKLPKKTGSGLEYITPKNVPPKTISIDCVSINGATPPPAIIAAIIIPTAPTSPIREAKSITKLQLFRSSIQESYHLVNLSVNKKTYNKDCSI